MTTEREALHTAQRALLHAEKAMRGPVGWTGSSPYGLVRDALDEVSSVLDEGRDEANEQVAT